MTFGPSITLSPESQARLEMEEYGASNREVRQKLASDLRIKMAKELADAWNNGKREQVRDTILRALDPQMSDQWLEDTAAELDADKRPEFYDFIGSAL